MHLFTYTLLLLLSYLNDLVKLGFDKLQENIQGCLNKIIGVRLKKTKKSQSWSHQEDNLTQVILSWNLTLGIQATVNLEWVIGLIVFCPDVTPLGDVVEV